MLLRIRSCCSVHARRTLLALTDSVTSSHRHSSTLSLSLSSFKRTYATEATSVPKSLLLRQKPPPAPTSQAQHPESASSLLSLRDTADQRSTTTVQPIENEIDSLLLAFHRHLQGRQGENAEKCPSIQELYEQLDAKSRIVLDEELPYEDTPSEDRKIRIDTTPKSRTWLEACQLANRRITGKATSIEGADKAEDGLVLVSHIVDASPAPITSWSLGFLITTSEGNNYAISCSHTLESVSITQ